jgi:hypothetical protein
LAALLLGVRGAPSDAKARAVRRFSTVAGAALVVVAATGVARAVDELSSWRDLVTTGYGRAVVVKVALLLFIAMLGLRHRQRSVPGAGSDLGPLRRTSRVELVLAAGALATAALLGTLSPPAAGQPAAPPGLTAVGSDADNTVRVRLTAVSAEPGPNRFVARVSDYDSNAPTRAGAITLRFVPLDDPRVSSTSLVLTPADGDVYEGSGANLAFDGRWGVTVLVPRGASTLQVPLELATREPPQPVSIQRIPGTAPKFTVAVGTVGFVRISPNHERSGLTRLSVISFDPFGDELPVKEIVVTAAAANGPTRQLRVRRVTASRFVTSVDLRVGRNTIGVVERTSDGTRLRATIPLRIRR